MFIGLAQAGGSKAGGGWPGGLGGGSGLFVLFVVWVEELVTLCSPCSGTEVLEDLLGEILVLMYARASQVMEETRWGETTERSSIGGFRQHQNTEGSHRMPSFQKVYLTGPISRLRFQTAQKICFHDPGYHIRVLVSCLVQSVQCLGSF